jgi:hypothetical protein
MKRVILNRLLDPEQGAPFEMRAALRTKLGMSPETAPAPSTNAPPESVTSQSSSGEGSVAH